jgi:magnesium transporter
MLTIVCGENGVTKHIQDVNALSTLLSDKSKPFWLDLEAPSEEEFKLLDEQFHFHPLAVEDAKRPFQRPKVDEYEGYIFVVADEVTLNLPISKSPSATPDRDKPDKDKDDDVQSRQLSMFLGSNYLVTIHITPVEAVRNLRDRCDHNHLVFAKGADFVLYTLLDELVDGYFPLLDDLDDSMDDLEDRVVDRPERTILETIFRLKRDLTQLRRHVGPLREVLQTLTTRDFPNIQDDTLPYLRDVADHLFRIYETLDSYRDLMSNMLDAYLSQVSNEMSRVMQKLSAVATVFMPITFLTGVFGMNFAVQPWLKTNVWFWLAFMAVFAGLNYWWFRRHRWV